MSLVGFRSFRSRSSSTSSFPTRSSGNANSFPSLAKSRRPSWSKSAHVAPSNGRSAHFPLSYSKSV